MQIGWVPCPEAGMKLVTEPGVQHWSLRLLVKTHRSSSWNMRCDLSFYFPSVLRITSGQRAAQYTSEFALLASPSLSDSASPANHKRSFLSPAARFSHLTRLCKSAQNVCLGVLINTPKGPNQENTGESQYSKNLPSLSCFSGVIVRNTSCVLENASCNFIRNKEGREYSWHVLYEPNCS